jgi:hypothetical protein
VDAALDDANVDRFLGMLGEFRKTTQFIVVTHNKGTMATCQSLYGVTMETKGVSRFVSVELSEVEDFTGNGEGEGPRPEAALDAESGEPVVELRPRASHREDALVAQESAAEVPSAD